MRKPISFEPVESDEARLRMIDDYIAELLRPSPSES